MLPGSSWSRASRCLGLLGVFISPCQRSPSVSAPRRPLHQCSLACLGDLNCVIQRTPASLCPREALHCASCLIWKALCCAARMTLETFTALPWRCPSLRHPRGALPRTTRLFLGLSLRHPACLGAHHSTAPKEPFTVLPQKVHLFKMHPTPKLGFFPKPSS